MKRTMIAGATLAAISIGSVAQAAEHTIVILPDAYFPYISYIDPGDTVRFVNVSGEMHEIVSKNGDWSLEIEAEAEVTMVIDEGVQKTFYDASSEEEDAEGNMAYMVEGKMSFAPPPIN